MKYATSCLKTAVLAVVTASAGCQTTTTYLVKATDLDQLSSTPPPPVIPAHRLDGTSVIVRTSMVINPVAPHFRRADELQKSGDYKRAAQELRTGAKLLDYATDAEWWELQEAMKMLDDGRGAAVSIPSLRAAQRVGALASVHSNEVQVEARNPTGKTAQVLGVVGGVLALGSIPIGIGVAYSGRGGSDGGSAVAGMTSGIVVGVSGVALLLASMGVAIAGRHGAEADAASLANQPQLMSANQLERELRQARRMTIGGGVGLALSVALAVAGTVMFFDSPYTPPLLSVADQQAYFGFQLTGGIFMGVGYGGVIPSLAVLAAGLHKSRKLRGIRRERGGSTAFRSFAPAPWIRHDGAGLLLSASF